MNQQFLKCQFIFNSHSSPLCHAPANFPSYLKHTYLCVCSSINGQFHKHSKTKIEFCVRERMENLFKKKVTKNAIAWLWVVIWIHLKYFKKIPWTFEMCGQKVGPTWQAIFELSFATVTTVSFTVDLYSFEKKPPFLKGWPMHNWQIEAFKQWFYDFFPLQRTATFKNVSKYSCICSLSKPLKILLVCF